MTCIKDIVAMIESESPKTNEASMALISIAERAAGYEQVLRRSQLSKLCFFCDSMNHMQNHAVTSSATTYIVC